MSADKFVAVQMPMREAVARALRIGPVLLQRDEAGAITCVRVQLNLPEDQTYTSLPLPLFLGVWLEHEFAGGPIDSPWDGQWFRVYHPSALG